jgi:hypothetical protein
VKTRNEAVKRKGGELRRRCTRLSGIFGIKDLEMSPIFKGLTFKNRRDVPENELFF